MNTVQREKDRNSPISSSEGASGSSSPRLVRPVPLSQKKQRSSSMNSVGSNQSTYQRSMSIISLESPRNSIISVDDNFLRPTRNNSTASLCSMGMAASPSDTVKESYAKPQNRHKMRHKNNNTSAIVSDEDSEQDVALPHGKGWRRRNSTEKAPRVLSSLKRDFKFRFDKAKPKPNTSHPSTPTSVSVSTSAGSGPAPAQSATAQIEDPVSSPLSLAHDITAFHAHIPAIRQHQPLPQHLPQHLHHHLQHSHPHQLHQPPQESPPPSQILSALWSQHSTQKPPSQSPGSSSPDDEPGGQLRTPSKKSRSSLMSQSMFLKKRMSVLSKDLQLELLETGASPNSPPVSALDTRFPLSTDSSTVAEEPATPPTGSARTHRSPSPALQSFLHEEGSVISQNKLITELNKKWNKAVLDSTEKRSDLVMAAPSTSTRKRDRSESVSSTDSHAIY